MSKTCKECKHYLAKMFHCQKSDVMAEPHNTCEDFELQTITNGDKIRQMRNEQLAKLIDNSCKARAKDVEECDAECVNGILAWLNAPAVCVKQTDETIHSRLCVKPTRQKVRED